jgi:hypothetical protein
MSARLQMLLNLPVLLNVIAALLLATLAVFIAVACAPGMRPETFLILEMLAFLGGYGGWALWASSRARAGGGVVASGLLLGAMTPFVLGCVGAPVLLLIKIGLKWWTALTAAGFFAFVAVYGLAWWAWARHRGRP